MQIGDWNMKIIKDEFFYGGTKRQIENMLVGFLISPDIFPRKRAFSDAADSVENDG